VAAVTDGSSARVPELATIGILIIDDHQMFAESVARGFDVEPGFTVLGVATTMAEGLRAATELRPNVALVDYQLPDGDGAQLASQIRAASPSTQVLMLTGRPEQGVVLAAIEAGCAGFVAKNRPLAELVQAARLASVGEAHITPSLLLDLLPRLSATRRREVDDLTGRELEILRLVASGTASRVIAEDLFVSVHTVRNHVQRAIEKLGAHSKLEAVAIARQRGILDVT
jgi:DNA-binding NarL/FixJ family response regulator